MTDFPVGTRTLVALESIESYAAAVWHSLANGAVVWLTGDLGSGKTTFARALTEVAKAEPARSPTFDLVHEYTAPGGLLVHVDCYRLRSPEEALDLDFPELTRYALAVLVEWPERAGSFVPDPDAHVSFGHSEDMCKRWIERIV